MQAARASGAWARMRAWHMQGVGWQSSAPLWEPGSLTRAPVYSRAKALVPLSFTRMDLQTASLPSCAAMCCGGCPCVHFISVRAFEQAGCYCGPRLP